jgi:Mg2+ and Co2+ transporter CorA
VLSSLARTKTSDNISSKSIRHVCQIVKERRNAWAGARESARQTYAELRDQIDLKQKAANVSEARAAARHGRVVLLITVVTIIFLPLSFLTSWFGMNSKDLNEGGKLRQGFIAVIIFPISIVIALFAFALAFSEALRNFIVGLFENVLGLISGHIGIYTSRRERRLGSSRRWTELTNFSVTSPV